MIFIYFAILAAVGAIALMGLMRLVEWMDDRWGEEVAVFVFFFLLGFEAMTMLWAIHRMVNHFYGSTP